jgi:NAD(P)-dependent dehydrogenase (short-subunit alcohol dehydrogenase family)
MTTDRFSVAGRTAIVTGASYGLGTTMASGLAQAGANVVLAARSADKLEVVAKELDGVGGSAVPIVCDIAEPAEVRALVAQAWERFGRVDILVNNAGAAVEAGMMPERVPDELFAATVRVNVNGTFTCCREVGARMLADGRGGSIVNIASVAGLSGAHHFPPGYQASKAAVVNLTRNLAASWAARGVRVNAIAPGWFPSEMTSLWFALPQFLDRVTRMAPMGRLGEPDELVGALLFLASDASSFVTGQVLAVDGGLSSTVGAYDYEPDLLAVLGEVGGQASTPIEPPGA